MNGRIEDRTVVLANGAFPRRGGLARRILASAVRVVCCDGAAEAYRRHLKRAPDAVVGDLDSFLPSSAPACAVVRIAEQDTNDLEKAVDWCRARGWRDIVVLGAVGKREDHTLGNVFRALALGVEIVTDCGRFVPVCGRTVFHLAKGAPLSVFAPDPATHMTSRGLVWPLDGVRFENLYCATLNRTSSTRVILTADRPVSVYLPL